MARLLGASCRAENGMSIAQRNEIEALKQRARSEAIGRHQERARARLARQAHLASVPKAA